MLLEICLWCVLGGDNDGVKSHSLIAVIFDRDLRLAIRTKIINRAVFANLG